MTEQIHSVKQLESAIETKRVEFEQGTLDGRPSEELSKLYKELKDLQMELALTRIQEDDNA